MLYELLSPSIELEIDRALDCSPMSVSTANPILRRLGVAGGGGERHFRKKAQEQRQEQYKEQERRRRQEKRQRQEEEQPTEAALGRGTCEEDGAEAYWRYMTSRR